MAERVVVVGGDAAGMSAASQARRRRDDLDIVALERGPLVSYSACGIPYVVAGDIGSFDRLVARRAQEFRDRHRIDVRLRHEVMAVDLDGRELEVRDHDHGRTFRLGFDQLVAATGGKPRRPDLPGVDLAHVHGVQTVADGEALVAYADQVQAKRVVVVGGGYIGLEMAEAMIRRGAAVTVVEGGPEVLRALDLEMGHRVRAAMERIGIEVRVGVKVEGFEPASVHTSDGPLAADVVVLGTGVAPASELFTEAGVPGGVQGALRVDRRQHTPVPGVWAAGDCAESFHRVSQQPVHVPLGTVANKQGRVAGINLGGGYATFPGVVGTAVTKVCSLEVGHSGLNEAQAAEHGFMAEAATIESTVKAGYLDDAGTIAVRLVGERGTGRLLGGQIVGDQGAAKRIDVVATALTAGMRVADLIDLDLGYAPPFSSVWDPLQVAARALEKRL